MPEQQPTTISDQRPHEPRRQRRRRIPQPLPPRDYLSRYELLALIPFCMSTVDSLERREVLRFMEERAKRRVRGPAAAARNTIG
jgi:hypothetical protein